ncbi:hypothetical protein PR048_010976 [Dryococelus australis]|uniref:Transposase n=1 Tax=Dryococelus australis TaxID=614101 RepID=A0ABQ9HKH9_9NEOP|nr:hypothetical protein PR048_010976 [Dryococelus australis]
MRHLTYNLAENKHLKHTFSNENKCAGLDWFSGFLKRHPNLMLRKPEDAREIGFSKTAVAKFFNILTSFFQGYNFSPERIYNVDETGLTSVTKSQPKAVAQKGRRQVGALISAERGQLVTAELCFSAAGH